MKVTIKDVAREANVATSTVSRVLSNSSKISEDTKRKVNAAIKKLNYTPNVVARSLANNRTRILAMVLPQGADRLFENPFFAHAMKGISVCAQQENYYIMYAFKEDNDEDWIKRFTESNIVDGLCLFNAKDNDEGIRYLKEKEFPFVIIGRPESVRDILWVDNDNFEAMYKLTQKLIDMGHRKIGFIGAKKHLNVAKDRLEGYKQGLFSRGIKINDDFIQLMNDFTEEEGYKATKNMILADTPTAIVCTDDLLAFGSQKLLLEEGLTDVAMVGFNNTPLAEYQKVPLASVDINSEELGFYATKLLIDKLEKKENNKRFYIIDTKLVERKSLFERKQANGCTGCEKKRKMKENEGK